MTTDPAHPLETATVAAGCFWCIEAAFQKLPGVDSARSGYMGGTTENPSYREVCTGNTGHAEVVQLRFDPDRITFEAILDLFWKLHDPTTLNRQGADVGTQYRSAIFYHDASQKARAEASMRAAQAAFAAPIVTEISPAETFYPAEDDHQNYFRDNPGAPYCQMLIAPKLRELGLV